MSLIAVHNHSGKEYPLKVGRTFVSIIFHYLKTPTYAKAHNKSPGQPSALLKYKDLKYYEDWVEKNDWTKEARKLKKKLLGSDEYRKLNRKKEEFTEESLGF